MAALLSCATGNFTNAATWALVDSTSLNDSIAANTVLTTSYVESSTFTPGAITIDAIAVKVALRVGTTGTISVRLAQGGATVAGTEVTINVSDIHAGDVAANGGCGWYVFKFAAPVLLVAATLYTVSAKTSSSTQVNLFSSATTNWSRLLRTTTTQAPVAGDTLHIAGTFTAAATSSTIDVTMNSTATTAYGQMTINNKSSLSYGFAAATNYYLKSQTIKVYGGASFSVGTVANIIPSGSTAVLEFNSASSGEHGLEIVGGGTLVVQGNPKTNWRSYMTVDKAAGATSITVTDTTDWAAGDEIAYPTTNRTITQCEVKTISSITNATTYATAALTNAHSGTAPYAAEVVNLTRNIKIRGMSNTNTAYLKFYTSASVDMDWAELVFMGTNSSAKYVVTAGITTGSVDINGCVWNSNSTSSSCAYNSFSLTTGSVSLTNNAIYNQGGKGILFDGGGSATVNVTLSNNYAIRCTGATCIEVSASAAFILTASNNKAVGGSTNGVSFQITSFPMTISGVESHGNSSSGLLLGSPYSGTTISNISCWNNGSNGAIVSGSAVNRTSTVVDGITLFSNGAANLLLSGNAVGTFILKNIVANGGTSLPTPLGLSVSGNMDGYQLINCDFGMTTGHTTADLTSNGYSLLFCTFYNCRFGSSTLISGQSSFPITTINYGGISSMNHNQVAGAVRTWSRMGTLITDTSIFRTNSPSARLSPISVEYKSEVCSRTVPCVSGGTVTVSAWVRKSVVGDGTAYNGAQPRLIVRANPAVGITTDTVLDTSTVAGDGAWEELTGTTISVTGDGALEFFIDCDGTTGWVNVDDFTTTSTTDPAEMGYWFNGYPALDGPTPGGSSGPSGGSYTFT